MIFLNESSLLFTNRNNFPRLFHVSFSHFCIFHALSARTNQLLCISMLGNCVMSFYSHTICNMNLHCVWLQKLLARTCNPDIQGYLVIRSHVAIRYQNMDLKMRERILKCQGTRRSPILKNMEIITSESNNRAKKTKMSSGQKTKRNNTMQNLKSIPV